MCGLTILIVSSSVFCSESNEFGIGLLLGTSKSKISNINEIKPEYNNEYIDIIKCLNTEFNGVLQERIVLFVKNQILCLIMY